MLSYQHAKVILRRRLNTWAERWRGYRINGLPSCDVVISDRQAEPRLNIVIIGIGRGSTFGGTETALRFFKAMQPYFSRARILALQESEGGFEPAEWPGWSLESQAPLADKTIAFLAQSGSRPQVEAGDCFIATHWLTAIYVRSLLSLRDGLHQSVSKFIYFIQDFEPGFYTWSGRYLVSTSTYAAPKTALAIFNTNLLKDFFRAQGYVFDTAFAFEPQLNPALAAQRGRLSGHVKKRQLIVYGRPSTPRNAFDLVVETLITWARTFDAAREWEVFSLGEPHRDIKLAEGVTLVSKGKMSLDGYAAQLLDAAVGLSLMVSPHPSYPPMEMAEFGVQVVTNNFANKTLSDRSGNIVSLADTSPEALAAALARLCDAHDRGETSIDMAPVFLGGDEEFPFAETLAALVKAPATTSG